MPQKWPTSIVRRLALLSIAHVGTQTDPLELQSLPLLESNACTRESGNWVRDALQCHASVQRVNSASVGC